MLLSIGCHRFGAASNRLGNHRGRTKRSPPPWQHDVFLVTTARSFFAVTGTKDDLPASLSGGRTLNTSRSAAIWQDSEQLQTKVWCRRSRP
jgi:hypothetical protein